MYYYRAFNLQLNSEVELPLTPSPPAAGDITFRFTPPDVQAGPPLHMAWSYHVTPRLATLDYAELGTLTLIEGREIRITLKHNADTTLLPSYLTGTAMAVLLYQRGLIVLEASAVVLAGKAVVLLSNKDGGKSTLAAVLHRRGHNLLADSFTAIDFSHGKPVVLPAFPMIQLDPQAVAAIGEDPAHLQRLHPHAERCLLQVTEGFSDAPAPLCLIFRLQTGIDNNVSYLPLQAALATVIYNSYPNSLLQPSGIEYLRQCSRLVSTTAVCQLTRRYDLSDLPEQAQMVEGTLLGQSSIMTRKQKN